MADRIQPLLLDPSPLATEAIARAKTELRDELKELLEAKADLLVTGGIGRHEKALLRIDAIEKAHETFKEDLLRVPTRLDERTETLKDLFDEKLHTLNIRVDTFHTLAAALREAAKEQAESHRQNAKEAVVAAFASAKEFTTASTTANNASMQSLALQISNLAERVGRNENAAASNEGMFAGGKGVIGGAIALLTVVILGTGLFLGTHDRSPGIVGADTQRVTDLIAQNNEQNRQTGQRLDALSARLNALTPPPKTGP